MARNGPPGGWAGAYWYGSLGWCSQVANLLTKILRMGEGRKVKVLQQRVGSVTALEPEVEKHSDEELRAKTEAGRGPRGRGPAAARGVRGGPRTRGREAPRRRAGGKDRGVPRGARRRRGPR